MFLGELKIRQWHTKICVQLIPVYVPKVASEWHKQMTMNSGPLSLAAGLGVSSNQDLHKLACGFRDWFKYC